MLAKFLLEKFVLLKFVLVKFVLKNLYCNKFKIVEFELELIKFERLITKLKLMYCIDDVPTIQLEFK